MANERIFSNFTINADAIPLYDSWGTADYWGCSEWINWHKAMVQKYGLQKANDRFINAWLDGLSVVAGGRGNAPGSNYIVDSVPLDCRSFNSDFRSYIKNNQALYDVVYSGLSGTIVKPIGATVDVVENVSGGLSNFSKVIRYGLPIIILLIAGIYAYKIYKK